MKDIKYTKELLTEAVKNSKCISDVCRYINGDVKKHIHGGVHMHIRNKIKEYEIDTSHFLSLSELSKLRENKGTPGKPPPNKRSAKELLIKDRTFIAHAKQIKRALLEIGREYKCEICGNTGEWNDKPMTLEIDHINGIKSDDRAKNLRFLCPNCHSQTKNYKSKNRRASIVG